MKIDLHCHTFFSNDGTSSVKKIIEEGKRKGIDGVAITDHENTDAWEEAVFWGKKLEFEIILGEEIKSSEGDILGLFMTKNINGKGKSPEWIIEKIKEQGGLTIIPHPFHEFEGFKNSLEKYVKLIDGIETFNGRRPFNKGDNLAKSFAEKFNLPKIGGSDSHYYKTVGNTYTECKANNLEDYKKQLKEGNTIIYGQKAPLRYIVFPLLKKAGLIKKPI
ncbi:PHP domain-containing protein [bacterium]|nr:PHP domain-containing protein [bacterium]